VKRKKISTVEKHMEEEVISKFDAFCPLRLGSLSLEEKESGRARSRARVTVGNDSDDDERPRGAQPSVFDSAHDLVYEHSVFRDRSKSSLQISADCSIRALCIAEEDETGTRRGG